MVRGWEVFWQVVYYFAVFIKGNLFQTLKNYDWEKDDFNEERHEFLQQLRRQWNFIEKKSEETIEGNQQHLQLVIT